ncbi:MAG: hypothetical protein R3F62_21020 [Planctomycetota bacterium]
MTTTSTHLVVGNLPPAVDLERLAAFFARFGRVAALRRGWNHLTGRPQRFCYLDLQPSSSSARPALALASARLDGRALQVSPASSPAGWSLGAW